MDAIKEQAMGSGASTEVKPEENEKIPDPVPELTDSDMASRTENRDKVHELPKIGKKKPIVRRASEMVRTANMVENEQAMALEQKILKANPSMKTIFKGFEECKAFLDDKNNQNDPCDTHFADLSKLLTDKVIHIFGKHSMDEERTVMANKLTDIGFVKRLVDYYNFVIVELGLEGVTEGFVQEARESEEPGDLVVLKAREILWNFSDSSPGFAEKIAETNMLKNVVGDLNYIIEDGLEQLEMEEEKFAFSSAVGILHNCARNLFIDRERFRSINTVEILMKFLLSNDVYIKTITLLALGNMVNEDEVDHMHAGTDVIEFLIEAINNSLDNTERKEHGFHLSELVDGLEALALSDKNKRQIMSTDPLVFIKKIMQSKNCHEVTAAIKLAWELAFLQENKNKMNADKEFMKLLKSKTNDTDKEVRNAALNASFVIEGMSLRSKVTEETSEVSSVVEKSAPSPSRPAGKHIMFSYSWGDKEMVYRIYHILRSQGYAIWIDIEEMGKYANLLEGMATAVENAHTILVCFSEKYKNSQNCRTEADYAFTLRKNIIPLKMQKGYLADGWLGIFIGARLYIEFTDKYPFDMKMKELKDQIPSSEEVGEPPDTPKPNPSTSAPPVKHQASVTDHKKVADWQKSDVEKWTNDNGMSGGSFKSVKQLTGNQLRFLRTVSMKAPDTFYSWCETKLKLKTIEELMVFCEAIEELNIFN